MLRRNAKKPTSIEPTDKGEDRMWCEGIADVVTDPRRHRERERVGVHKTKLR
jgi:hypothetical protein